MPQAVLKIAARLAQTLGDSPDGAVLAEEATDVAARAVLRRIKELDRSLALLPELATPNPADLQLLRSLRQRTFRRTAALSTRVSELLLQSASYDLLFPIRAGKGGEFLRVCAWCDRIAARAGRWLPMGEYLEQWQELRITHTMCEDCYESRKQL